jgi:hypothetical protein
MSDHRAGAFFYLLKAEPRSLIELARASGMVDPGEIRVADEPGAEMAVGEWGPLIGVLARRREYDKHVALEFFFSFYRWSDFYEGSDYERRDTHPVEDDPALPLAYAFRDTCLRLDAEVGILTLNNLVADTDYQEREIYPNVARYRVDQLAIDAGLLYLNERRKDLLLGLEALDEQDQLPTERGILLFGGRGVDRWH